MTEKSEPKTVGSRPKDITEKVEIPVEKMCCAICGVFKKSAQELGCTNETERAGARMLLNLGPQVHLWIESNTPFSLGGKSFSGTCANAILVTAYSQAGVQGVIEIIAGGVPQMAVEKRPVIIK